MVSCEMSEILYCASPLYSIINTTCIPAYAATSHTTQAVLQNPTMIISTKQTSAALGKSGFGLKQLGVTKSG